MGAALRPLPPLRHPDQLSPADVGQRLSSLATTRRASDSTQIQALAAILFLYREVLQSPLPMLDGVVRMEALTLRVKDVDVAGRAITIRSGKGAKDRVTILPDAAVAPLRQHLARVRALHASDLVAGGGRVVLPGALDRKLPAAGRDWGGSGCFPRRRGTSTGAPASGAATTCMRRPCSVLCGTPPGGWDSRSGRRVTLSGTPSPPISFTTGTTFGPCRSCSGTRMSARP